MSYERNPTLRALDRIVEYLDTAHKAFADLTRDMAPNDNTRNGFENLRLARADAMTEATLLRRERTS